MTITVEDGTGVTGANSVVTSAETDAFLSARGLSMPTGFSDYDDVLLSAMDALKYLSYKGEKVSDENDLPFPRSSVYDREGNLYDNDTVPVAFKEAQMWLCYYLSTGTSLKTQSTPSVKSEKVDVITTVFNTTPGESTQVSLKDLPNVYAPLKHLLTLSSGFGRVVYA